MVSFNFSSCQCDVRCERWAVAGLWSRFVDLHGYWTYLNSYATCRDAGVHAVQPNHVESHMYNFSNEILTIDQKQVSPTSASFPSTPSKPRSPNPPAGDQPPTTPSPANLPPTPPTTPPPHPTSPSPNPTPPKPTPSRKSTFPRPCNMAPPRATPRCGASSGSSRATTSTPTSPTAMGRR